MLLQLLFKGLLTGFLVSFPIGPIAVLVIQRTANRSFRSGFYSGIGVALTDTIWAIIAGFSLSYIITFLREHQSIIQIVGALALLGLGFHIFSSHPLKSIRKEKRKSSNPIQCFFTAMLFAFSNPAVLLAYIAVFASTNMVFSLASWFNTVVFLVGFFLGAISWWFLLTSLINMFRHRFNLRLLWWFNKISGSMIMIFVLISTIVVLIKGNPEL